MQIKDINEFFKSTSPAECVFMTSTYTNHLFEGNALPLPTLHLVVGGAIRQLYKEGKRCFFCSMENRYDIYCAQLAVALKKSLPGLRVAVAVGRGAEPWEEDKVYRYADGIFPEFKRGLKSRWKSAHIILSHMSTLLGYFNEHKPVVFEAYAKSHGIAVINLHDALMAAKKPGNPLPLSLIPPLPPAIFQPKFSGLEHVSDYMADVQLLAWVTDWASRNAKRASHYYLGITLSVFIRADCIFIQASAEESKHYLFETIQKTEDVQAVCAKLREMAHRITDSVMRCRGGFSYHVSLAMRYADTINRKWPIYREAKRRELLRTICIVTKYVENLEDYERMKGVMVRYLPFSHGGVYPKLQRLPVTGITDISMFITDKTSNGYFVIQEDDLDRIMDDYDDSEDIMGE